MVPLWGHVRVAVVALTLGVGAAAIALPSRAGTARSGGSITGYDVAVTVRSDGVVHVRESISYDFGDSTADGIVRTMPYRVGNRLFRIGDLRAESTTGAPATPSTSRFLHDLRIKVGGRPRVTGLQAYVLEYDVSGLLTRYPDRDELTWNAVGTGWDVPIDEVDVRVYAPVRLLSVGCLAGRSRLTTSCPAERLGKGQVAAFSQDWLTAHEGLTVQAALPRGAVAVAPPMYARPHLLFTWMGAAGVGACLVAAAAGWGMGRGRSRPAGVVLRVSKVTGTIAVAAGVGLVTWDTADDIVTGGLWEASVGDPALIGLGLMITGSVVLLTGWNRPAHDPRESGHGSPPGTRVTKPPA